MTEFDALVLHEQDGKVTPRLERRRLEDLPPGDVLVRVRYSTVNYKDGLILNGLGRLVRNYPHVPGIDFAGTVEASDNPEWRPGDEVILTGWRVGEAQWGGYAGYARVKGEWLVPLPLGLTAQRAMAIGTAGFTSMLAILALERHGLAPDAGEVLVTGAAGGVGGIATAVLAKLGYPVVASTGRAETHDYLKELGAIAFIDRAALATPSAKPLQAERWAGAVDAVGGPTLATVLTQLRLRASVAACGNAGGMEFTASVLPFIMRGVNLLGIDSVLSPRPLRIEAWHRLARDLPMALLDRMIETIRLSAVPEIGKRILEGRIRGRVVVEID